MGKMLRFSWNSIQWLFVIYSTVLGVLDSKQWVKGFFIRAIFESRRVILVIELPTFPSLFVTEINFEISPLKTTSCSCNSQNCESCDIISKKRRAVRSSAVRSTHQKLCQEFQKQHAVHSPVFWCLHQCLFLQYRHDTAHSCSHPGLVQPRTISRIKQQLLLLSYINWNNSFDTFWIWLASSRVGDSIRHCGSLNWNRSVRTCY